MSFINEELILNKSISKSVFQNIYWHLQWPHSFLYKMFIFLSWKIKLVLYSYFGNGSQMEIFLCRSPVFTSVHRIIFWDVLKAFHFMIRALLIVRKVLHFLISVFWVFFSNIVMLLQRFVFQWLLRKHGGKLCWGK